MISSSAYINLCNQSLRASSACDIRGYVPLRFQNRISLHFARSDLDTGDHESPGHQSESSLHFVIGIISQIYLVFLLDLNLIAFGFTCAFGYSYDGMIKVII